MLFYERTLNIWLNQERTYLSMFPKEIQSAHGTSSSPNSVLGDVVKYPLSYSPRSYGELIHVAGE